jgi:iron complex outermembrane receptor protein
MSVFGEVQAEEYMEMSLDDLLNLKIGSVSKKEESTFDAPLSSTVITRQEILNSGATSIQEAMRLVPGLIVREQSPGNFDIHLRGFDNVPPNSTFAAASNLITLVMIDNRPIYSYLRGGTFWETLPVSINDVEKIEIVRGPSSALYGPNAASGIINIITRRAKKEGTSFSSDVQAGEHSTTVADGSLSYRYKDKFSMVFSGNTQQKDRYETSYYDIRKNIYVSDPKNGLLDTTGRPLSNPDERYPDPNLSVDQKAANAFINFTPTERVEFDMSFGTQESRAQKIYAETRITPFSTFDSDSGYIDFKLRAYNFTGQISYLSGNQHFLGTGSQPGSYSMDTVYSTLEYDFNWKNFSLKPGISYSSVIYDGVILNGEQEINTYAFSLRTEYAPCEKWRFIAALREDNYNHPDDMYLSYQFAATYKPDDNQLIRAAYSRSHRAPMMVDTFFDYKVYSPGVYDVRNVGNTELDLLTTDMAEIGYRRRLSKHFTLDSELFYAVAQDYDDLVLLSKSDPSAKTYSRSQFENLAVKAQQYGLTLSLNYMPNEIFYAKVFGTFQYTHLKDQAPMLNSELYNALSLEDGKHESTPLFYGGFYVNYKLSDKWNMNTSGYYYTGNTHIHNPTNFGTVPVFDIDPKFLWNAKISYNVCKYASIYLNVRNLLNDTAQEYAWADEIGRTILAGVHVEF